MTPACKWREHRVTSDTTCSIAFRKASRRIDDTLFILCRGLPGKMLNEHSRIPPLIFVLLFHIASKYDLDATKQHGFFPKSPIPFKLQLQWPDGCKHQFVPAIEKKSLGLGAPHEEIPSVSPCQQVLQGARYPLPDFIEKFLAARTTATHVDLEKIWQFSRNCHEKMNGKYANELIDPSIKKLEANKQETHTPWANKGVCF